MSLEEVIEKLKESGKEGGKLVRNLVQSQLNSIIDFDVQVLKLELIQGGKGLKVTMDLPPLYARNSLIKEIDTLDMFPDESVRISSVTVSSYHPNFGEIIKSSKRLNLLRGIVSPTFQLHQAWRGDYKYVSFKGFDSIKVEKLNDAISGIAALRPGAYLLMPNGNDTAPIEKVSGLVRRIMMEEGFLDEYGTVGIHNIKVAESTPDFASFDVYLGINTHRKTANGTIKSALKATVNCYLQPTNRMPYEENEIKGIEVVLPEEFEAKVNWLGGGTYNL